MTLEQMSSRCLLWGAGIREVRHLSLMVLVVFRYFAKVSWTLHGYIRLHAQISQRASIPKRGRKLRQLAAIG